jgi:hypothetical protein
VSIYRQYKQAYALLGNEKENDQVEEQKENIIEISEKK